MVYLILPIATNRPFTLTQTFVFFATYILQVNRPLTMKKDGIQTRNRKVSNKNKKGKKNVPIDAYPEMMHGPPPDDLGGHYSLSQGSLLSYSHQSHLLSPTASLHPSASLPYTHHPNSGMVPTLVWGVNTGGHKLRTVEWTQTHMRVHTISCLSMSTDVSWENCRPTEDHILKMDGDSWACWNDECMFPLPTFFVFQSMWSLIFYGVC